MELGQDRQSELLRFDVPVGGGTICLVGPQRRITLRGKAVEFILALIVTPPAAFLTRDDLHRLHGWKGMSAGSVGKQAARIIDKINSYFGLVIEWGLKTGSWRLIPAVHQNIPDETRARSHELLARNDWARILRFDRVPVTSIARWMQLCGSALADMTEGRAAVGYNKLRQAHELSEHEDIAAISDVLATRIGQALPRPHLPIPAASVASTFLEVAEARRMAAYARLSSTAEWHQQFDMLHHRLLRMIQIGDTATQAILFNAMAMLARRMGRMDQALDCIREAAALAIFSGDFVLIQNTSFNFGNIVRSLATDDPQAFAPDIFLGLLRLDVELRERLRIGKDSAQAELLLALLCHEQGNFAEAAAYLTKADEIIALSRQEMDLALRERLHGLLQCDTSPAGSPAFAEGLKALQRSVALYSSHSNLVSAAEVEADLHLRQELQEAAQ